MKIFLLPGETKKEKLTLNDRALDLRDEVGDLMPYQGTLDLYAGTHQPDVRSEQLTGMRPECFPVAVNKTELIEQACARFGGRA